ncbi:MAG: sortase [Ilumatobacteraceae bacterium]|jgi:sortase A
MAKDEKTSQGRISRLLDVLGRTMIAAGLLLLSFVAYQLWGTGIAEGRAQNAMATQFVQPQPALPTFGGLVGRITIPSIGVSKYLVAGVRLKDLERGPGLFPGSPLPGQKGNVAIAGHRTTYGAPFSRIDEIHDKAIITLESRDGTFTYIVNGEPKVIAATDTAVTKTTNAEIASLTLVSCYPKWTSSQRIIVVATLDSTVTPLLATPFTVNTTIAEQEKDGWFHDPTAWPTVLFFGFALIAIRIIAAIMTRRGRRKIFVYLIAGGIFVPTLFLFFGGLARLLPANL